MMKFPQKRIKITPFHRQTLRYLATGAMRQLIGDSNGVDKATVSRAIPKVINAIARRRAEFINMPDNEQAKNKIKQSFFNISKFPRCVGAVDCTHVKIQSPGGNDTEIYRNRKGYFSFNVQGICDANLKILDLVCRWPGSAHDCNIFKNSNVNENLVENNNLNDNRNNEVRNILIHYFSTLEY
jgi:hypothetical protein